MAKIDSIFKKEIKRTEPHPRRVVKWIHYTKLMDNEDQYCNERSKEEIEALADLIEADGEVLQDLLVRRMDTDAYKIIAGHKRRRACRLLVEERGNEQFAFLPCYVMDVSDVQAEFRLYSSNGYHEKTDFEKMRELERMRYLIENYPEEFPQVQNGRMVERLAKLLNMKKTTVGEYLTISKNLSDKGMEKFQEGSLKKSAALELAGMPLEEQDQLLDQGVVKQSEIRKMKLKEQEQLSAYGTKKREHPEDSGETSMGLDREEVQDQTANVIHDTGAKGNESKPLDNKNYGKVPEKTDLELLKEMLEKAEDTLKQIREEFGEKDIRVRKQKITVAAFAGMISTLDMEELPEPVRQEFPEN